MDGRSALRESVQNIRKGDMKTYHDVHVPGVDKLEYKANELTSLMFSLCEDRVVKGSVMPDGYAESLTSAAVAARSAIKTFLVLKSIPPI